MTEIETLLRKTEIKRDSTKREISEGRHINCDRNKEEDGEKERLRPVTSRPSDELQAGRHDLIGFSRSGTGQTVIGLGLVSRTNS